MESDNSKRRRTNIITNNPIKTNKKGCKKLIIKIMKGQNLFYKHQVLIS